MTVTKSNIETLARPDYSAYEREELWNEIIPGLWQGGTADHDTVHTARKNRTADAYKCKPAPCCGVPWNPQDFTSGKDCWWCQRTQEINA